MNIKLLFFGITQDLVGNHTLNMEIEKAIAVDEFKKMLFQQYIGLQKFPNFAVAVNEQYADDKMLINDGDVIAIIPPVSGG